MVVSFIASFAPSPIALLRDQVGWKFYPELNRSLLSLTPFIEPTLEHLYIGNLKYKSTVLPIFTISIVCIATILLALSLKTNKAWRYANKSLPKDTMANRENKEARSVKMVNTYRLPLFLVGHDVGYYGPPFFPVGSNFCASVYVHSCISGDVSQPSASLPSSTTIATVFIISSVPPSVHTYLDVLVPGSYSTGRYIRTNRHVE